MHGLEGTKGRRNKQRTQDLYQFLSEFCDLKNHTIQSCLYLITISTFPRCIPAIQKAEQCFGPGSEWICIDLAQLDPGRDVH